MYEVGVPPVVGGVTVTFISVSPAVTLGVPGTPGGVLNVELLVTDCPVKVAASLPTES